MSLGSFETRLVASAKLSTMEKYGWCYSEDLAVVKSMLTEEVEITDDGSGVVQVKNALGVFQVKVRDYQKQEIEKDLHGNHHVAADPSREGKYISVWDVTNH